MCPVFVLSLRPGRVGSPSPNPSKKPQSLNSMLKHKLAQPLGKAKSFALDDVRKEIEMLREMDHPSIVRLYAAYEDNVSIYLVMELCEGGELFDRLIEESHLTEPAVQTIMRQVFGAVAHCHDKHIVHRDLKPAASPNLQLFSMFRAGIAVHECSKRLVVSMPRRTLSCRSVMPL